MRHPPELGKNLRAVLLCAALGWLPNANAQTRALEYTRKSAHRTESLALREDLTFLLSSDTERPPAGFAEFPDAQRRARRQRGLAAWDDADAGAPVFTRPGAVARSASDPLFDPLIMTRKILIQTDAAEEAQSIGDSVNAWRVSPTVSPTHFMLRFRRFEHTWKAAETLRARGIESNIQFKRRVLIQQIPPEFLPDGFPSPSDPLLPEQWHLINMGQGIGTVGVDANVTPAWARGYTGEGVTIAVADNGVDTGHPDLDDNALPVFDASGAPWHRSFGSDEPDPSVGLPFGVSHGTEVAGVSAAEQDNGQGGSGAAPDANLIAIRFESAGPALFIDDEVAAETFTWRLDRVDVHNNSWGSGGFDPAIEPLTAAALEQAANEGRNGRGLIIVKAGGNSGRNVAFETDNLNVATYEAINSSRYTIAVGGFGNRGLWTFSEPGSCLVISAPTAGFTNDRFITTTTIRGRGANGGDYTESFGGTSSASPLVSGCIALILDANPNLGWRDVQEILIRSADLTDPEHEGWQTNGAGFHFNNLYGAGAINADAAIDLALGWRNLNPELRVEAAPRRAVNFGLVDGDDTFGREVRIDVSDNIRVEHVVLHITAQHPQRGQLRFEVTSPQGTKSVIERRLDVDFAPDFQDWGFLSVQHWGETSAGRWRVRAYDTWEDGVSGQWTDARLTFYGSDPNATPPLDTTTYDGWRALTFAETAPPEQTGPGDDFDNDGLINLWEYYRGLDPTVNDHTPFLRIAEAPNGFEILFRERANHSELNPVLEVSHDLAQWNAADGLDHWTRSETSVDGQPELRNVRYRFDEAPAGARYMRFRLRATGTAAP